MEFFQQHEGDVGFEFTQRFANRRQIIVNADRQHFVSQTTQRFADIEFRLPGIEFLIADAVKCLGGNMAFANKHQDT